jgi:hypothetical protein
MLAKELVQRYGSRLINEWILTEPIGEYPGGIARVIELTPDKNAPEIPIQVNLPGWGKIGIFEDETVALITDFKAKRYALKEEQEDPHEGMIYNPITETWNWF